MGRRKAKAKPLDITGPTDSQFARSEYIRAGIAYRKVPMIDTLLKEGQITQREHDALSYYRDQATRAEDDTAESGPLDPDKAMGGSSQSGTNFIPAKLCCTPAILETGRIERDLGQLRDIAYAIAVADKSLTQWCIERHGGRERYNGRGEFVAIVPISEKRNIGIARIELKHAAWRIVR